MSWIERSQAAISLTISENRTAPLSIVSNAQRGMCPQARMVKQVTRSRGLYASSKGQLMKTGRARSGLLPAGGRIFGHREHLVDNALEFFA
jgi:hypothetical protein